jgi:MarR family 2-MHQ and catechol resistance regulon transcriptional repressor
MGMHEKSPNWLALYGLVQVNARVLERVGAGMEARTGVSMSSFEVLANLKDAERMRMSDLADALLLSRGGVTRLIARMEEAGLVRRETPPEDRRATYAVITDAGREAIERATPVHLELAEEAFGQYLGDDAPVLLRTFVRVLEGNGAPCDWLLEGVHADEALG